MEDERWLTPSQVAARLQVSLDTVLRQLRAGTLPGGRIGRQWRIHPDDLEGYLRRQRGISDRPAEVAGAGSPARAPQVIR